MKEKISALMDGELDRNAAGEPIGALRQEGEAAEAWRTYHLISDAMRDTQLLSPGFRERFSQRLAAEPTVLAPTRRQASPSRRWIPAAAVAGAAVALVGWVAFAPQPASVQAPMASVQPAAEAKPAVTASIPKAANDYLLAHQAVSPRLTLQGMAPYVRTVADEGTRR
jgi:sigma-E factor negative regulatory protein RseA